MTSMRKTGHRAVELLYNWISECTVFFNSKIIEAATPSLICTGHNPEEAEFSLQYRQSHYQYSQSPYITAQDLSDPHTHPVDVACFSPSETMWGHS